MKLPKYVASEYHELKKLKKKGSKKVKKDTRGTLVDPSAHPRGKGEPR
jgi:hypothetical protein